MSKPISVVRKKAEFQEKGVRVTPELIKELESEYNAPAIGTGRMVICLESPLGDGELDGFQIICPRHGARFDIRSGKALMLPAVVDTPWYPVRVVDGWLEIGLPV